MITICLWPTVFNYFSFCLHTQFLYLFLLFPSSLICAFHILEFGAFHGQYTRSDSVKGNWLPSWSYDYRITPGLEVGLFVNFPSACYSLINYPCSHRFSEWCHNHCVYNSPLVSWKYCFFLVIHIWLLQYLHPIFWNNPWFLGKRKVVLIFYIIQSLVVYNSLFLNQSQICI